MIGIAITLFVLFGACTVPYALIAGKPMTVNGVTVRDWSTINTDVISFQSCVTGLLVVCLFGLRKCWIDGRKNEATFPHAVQREWSIGCRDPFASHHISGLGASAVTRRLRVECRGSSLRSFRASADRGARLTVLLDGIPVREIVTKPWSDYDKERAIQVDVPPGIEPAVRTSVDSKIAGHLPKWSVDVSLLGDPNPPAELSVTCKRVESCDRLTPSGPTRR